MQVDLYSQGVEQALDFKRLKRFWLAEIANYKEINVAVDPCPSLRYKTKEHD